MVIYSEKLNSHIFKLLLKIFEVVIYQYDVMDEIAEFYELWQILT